MSQSKYLCAIFSAAVGFLGTILLFYSFQAASTPFLLVINKDSRAYLCVGNRALFSMTQDGSLGVGTSCGDTTNARPAAVVNLEHRSWGIIGFVLLLLSFGFQGFAIEKPRPVEIPHQSFGPRQKSPSKSK